MNLLVMFSKMFINFYPLYLTYSIQIDGKTLWYEGGGGVNKNKNRLSVTILAFTCSAEPDILKYPLSRFTCSDLDVFLL